VWECGACACTNKDITCRNCVICQTKHSVRYAIGGCPIDPVSGRMLINRLALPMEEPAIAAEAPAVMVKTRQTATEGAVSIATPPPPCQQGKPNTPSTDRTMPLPATLQQEVNKCHEKSCRIIASNILCVRLHCRIAKIKQMSTNVCVCVCVCSRPPVEGSCPLTRYQPQGEFTPLNACNVIPPSDTPSDSP
jgi:hypothetical protein